MDALRERSKIKTPDFTMNSCQNQQYQRSSMQRSAIMDRLRQEGCRITRQRKIILDIILQEECTCCKEIYYKASMKDSGIGMATVYRMINMLERIGAISRKNLYRISCDRQCDVKEAYTVELSDHTICQVPPHMWNNIVRAGLKEYGYIADQEVAQIMPQACEKLS